MALTQSTMMKLGTKAPQFELPSTDGKSINLAEFKEAKGLVVLFICNHCPYVIHIAPALAALAQSYIDKGIAFVAISSNDAQHYPADSFAKMAEEKQKWDYPFPYLYDESQAVAKLFNAACTPDIFVFDHEQNLYYRGQFDDSRPNRISSGNYDSSVTPATGDDLQNALDDLLHGKSYPDEQIPSMGCNIKWIEGNEPDYF